MRNRSEPSYESDWATEQEGPGRGCLFLLIVLLIILLLCFCLIVGLVMLYQFSPGSRELITGLLRAFLVG